MEVIQGLIRLSHLQLRYDTQQKSLPQEHSNVSLFWFSLFFFMFETGTLF